MELTACHVAVCLKETTDHVARAQRLLYLSCLSVEGQRQPKIPSTTGAARGTPTKRPYGSTTAASCATTSSSSSQPALA